MANSTFSFRKLMAVASDNRQEAANKISSVAAGQKSDTGRKNVDVNDNVKKYKERLEREKQRAEVKKKKQRESLLQARIEKQGGVTREIAETFKLPFALRLSGADAKIDHSAIAAIPGTKAFRVPEDELVGSRKKKHSQDDQAREPVQVEEKKPRYEEPVRKPIQRPAEQKRSSKPAQKPMDFHSLLQIANSVKNDPTPLMASAGVKITKPKKTDEPTTRHLLADRTVDPEVKVKRPKPSERHGSHMRPSTSDYPASSRRDSQDGGPPSSQSFNRHSQSKPSGSSFKIPKSHGNGETGGKDYVQRSSTSQSHSSHNKHNIGPKNTMTTTSASASGKKRESHHERQPAPSSSGRPAGHGSNDHPKKLQSNDRKLSAESAKTSREKEPPAFVVVNGVKYFMEGAQKPDNMTPTSKANNNNNTNIAQDSLVKKQKSSSNNNAVSRAPPVTNNHAAAGNSGSKHNGSSAKHPQISSCKSLAFSGGGLPNHSMTNGVSAKSKSAQPAPGAQLKINKAGPTKPHPTPSRDHQSSSVRGGQQQQRTSSKPTMNGSRPVPNPAPRPRDGPRPPAWASAPGMSSGGNQRKREMYKDFYEQYEREERMAGGGYDSEEEEDSEEDSDMDDFIDDSVQEGEDVKVSDHIKEIFKYDRSKYSKFDDRDDRKMEVGFRQCQMEDARTARVGAKEDLEEWRKEQEETKRKMARDKRK